MESYIHLYKTNEEFTAAYNSPNYKEPWLSLTEDTMAISYSKILTAITFNSITWVTDVPAKGGTATKDNCEFKVYANYDNGSFLDISSIVTVEGTLAVPSSTEGQRHEIEQPLTLTASYSGFTATGNVTVYQAAVPDFSTKPLTFKISSPGTINWTTLFNSTSKEIQYKLNDREWASITSNIGESAPSIEVNAGDKIQFRGNNATYGEYLSSSAFSGSTAGFEVEGNIMSLINPTDFITTTTLESNYTFSKLFIGCTGLTSAENLILPSTTLKVGCYMSMFNGCTSLKTAPELPATTLASVCYGTMFARCKSLTIAPKLPATTLASMCYDSMFFNCESLNYIKCLAKDVSADRCTSSWVNGVASTGTFIKSPNMTSWTTGENGIPSGWTVQNAS